MPADTGVPLITPDTEFSVRPTGSADVLNTIEVVFLKKGAGPWHLAGYEYPVPIASLTPKAMSAIKGA